MVPELTLNQSIRLVNHLLAAARTKTLTCPATKLSSTCLVQFDNATGNSSVSPQHRPILFSIQVRNFSNDGGRYLKNGYRRLGFEEEARNEMPFVAQAQTPVRIDYNLISLLHV